MNVSINSPFDRMYGSFALFSEAAKANKQKFYPLSAGVNWVKANTAIMKLMHYELDSAMTYRNYGRSSGIKFITDLLAVVERDMAKVKTKPSVIICNGSSEGSYLVFEYLSKSGFIKEGDKAMMVSHGFSLHAHLSSTFKLHFLECLNEDPGFDSFLAPMEKVTAKIEQEKPKLIFLLLPNNPFGERYNDSDLEKLKNTCRKHGTKILIDRVCLLPWDNYEQINRVFMDYILEGGTFIVDSMSKSESFAGVRTGYLVTNTEVEEAITKIIRYRHLNPIVYSTFSMAVSKILSLIVVPDTDEKKFARALRMFIDNCLLSYPSDELTTELDTLLTPDLIAEYYAEMQSHKDFMLGNFNFLKQVFGELAIKDLKLESGFNVALTTERMIASNQKTDQQTLAFKHNVGVLTENCFRISEKRHGNYFIRIGLTIPKDDFEEAVTRLQTFFHK